MLIEKIIKFVENWAPPGAAWAKDNVGLQVGSTKRKISNIFLCLELTEKALNEAISKNCNFIFTHHPLIFKPIKNINTNSSPKGKLIEQLIKRDITLYSAHTNLDFTKEGVSFELAKMLKLENLQFLEYEKANQYKVVVFVPKKEIKSLTNKIFESGGGIIGEYENCSFSSEGLGSFKGSLKSNPTLGQKENLEIVNEIRLEVLVNSWKLNQVLSVIKKSHPYEEPVVDVYPLENDNVNYGYGVVGTLAKSMKKNDFLQHVCNSLNTKNLRFNNGKKGNIKKVAVCGGSGSDLLVSALKNKADAFVTADLKYHAFQDAEDRILFVDAGHYETEIHVLNIVKRKFENLIKRANESVKIYRFSGSSNPIKFFNKKGAK